MITENWRDVQTSREQEQPGKVFIFVEMRRPQPGTVIFEAPEYGVVREYQGVENFAPLLKTFLQHDVGPLVPAKHPTGSGFADIILIDPAWNDDRAQILKYGNRCRTRGFPAEPKVRGIGWCYEHRRWCGNDGPPEGEEWR